MLRPPLPLLPETSQLGLQRGAQRCLRTGLPCAALGQAWVSQWILDLWSGWGGAQALHSGSERNVI